MIDAMNTFVYAKPMDEKSVKAFEGRVPSELIAIWREKGLGTLLKGYLKFIDPNDYAQLVKDTYYKGEKAIPIMVTAFGDIIVWQDGRYVYIVMYRYGTFNSMISDMKIFLRCLGDESFWKYHFTLDAYNEAVEMYGPLGFDECFGYTPLLSLGGLERAEYIKKVKIREHISLISQVSGVI